MRKFLALVALAACGGGEDPAPDCQTAVTAFYAAGCTFVDFETGQPVPAGEIIVECRGFVANAPGSCEDAVDDWRRCLATATAETGCDCAGEQEALLTCD